MNLYTKPTLVELIGADQGLGAFKPLIALVLVHLCQFFAILTLFVESTKGSCEWMVCGNSDRRRLVREYI